MIRSPSRLHHLRVTRLRSPSRQEEALRNPRRLRLALLRDSPPRNPSFLLNLRVTRLVMRQLPPQRAAPLRPHRRCRGPGRSLRDRRLRRRNHMRRRNEAIRRKRSRRRAVRRLCVLIGIPLLSSSIIMLLSRTFATRALRRSLRMPRFRSFTISPFVSVSEQFNKAKEAVTRVPEVSNQEKLRLYALYKQATEGPNTQPEPGMFNVVVCSGYGSRRCVARGVVRGADLIAAG